MDRSRHLGRFLVACSSLALVAGCAPDASTLDVDRGPIGGGTACDEGDWPAVGAYLAGEGGIHAPCLITLIDPQIVLAGARCAERSGSGDRLFIGMDVHDMVAGDSYSIAEIHPHADHDVDPEPPHDVAILLSLLLLRPVRRVRRRGSGPGPSLMALALIGAIAGGCDRDDGTPDPGDDDDVTGDDDDATVDDDDTSADDDDDTAGTIDQPPITFTVVNDTDATRYIYWLEWWSDDLNEILSCAADTGDGWRSCLFGLPFSADECTPEVQGGDCSNEIDSGPATWILPAGAGLDVVWPGTLWTGDTEYCATGVCYREGSARAGQYGATIVVWDETICVMGQCDDPGPDGGLVWGASVLGNSSAHHVEFELPYDGDVLEITIDD